MFYTHNFSVFKWASLRVHFFISFVINGLWCIVCLQISPPLSQILIFTIMPCGINLPRSRYWPIQFPTRVLFLPQPNSCLFSVFSWLWPYIWKSLGLSTAYADLVSLREPHIHDQITCQNLTSKHYYLCG